MKVGIFTYHRAHNYGAQLQACALCNRLNQEMGIEAQIIDFSMLKEKRFYSIFAKKKIKHPKSYLKNFAFNWKLFRTFKKAKTTPIMRCSKEQLTSNSLEKFQNFVKGRYDVIVAGSDEIWKIDGYRGFPTPYWLLGDLQCRKFSYAASSRSDFTKLDCESKELLLKNFSEFEYIGVREQSTADSLRNLGVDADKIHVCCDPSFLYDFPVRTAPMRELLESKTKLDSSKKNIVVMTNNHKLAQKIKHEFSEEFNLISVFNNNLGYYNVPNLQPLEWAEVIKNADLVLTTYFHGTCFSIIYNTPFISFGSKKKSSKIIALFEEKTSFSERYIEDTDAFLKRKDFKEAVLRQLKPFDSSSYIEQRRKEFIPFIHALKEENSDERIKV